MREKGMGRARLGRFAAITVPAAVVTAGLGVAIVQGAIGATLSSADAFNLKSTTISSDSLKVRPGVASVGGTDNETIYAQTGHKTSANGVDIVAQVSLPVITSWTGKKVNLSLTSTDPTVSLPDVILNAKTLGVADPDSTDQAGTDADPATGANSAASLTDVDLGITQDKAGFTDKTTDDTDGDYTGYSASGFALSSGAATLNKVDADAYAIHLSGLSLDNLSIGVSLK